MGFNGLLLLPAAEDIVPVAASPGQSAILLGPHPGLCRPQRVVIQLNLCRKQIALDFLKGCDSEWGQEFTAEIAKSTEILCVAFQRLFLSAFSVITAVILKLAPKLNHVFFEAML